MTVLSQILIYTQMITMRFAFAIVITDSRKKMQKNSLHALRTDHLILDFSFVTGTFAVFFYQLVRRN